MTSWVRVLAVVLSIGVFAPGADAALFGRHKSHPSAAILALRHRLHVNSLITEPGTFEIEWSNAFNLDSSYTMPLLLKVTPEGKHLLWGRTEFSAAVDVVPSIVSDDRRSTHLADHVTLSATTLLVDGEHWNLAVAPQINAWTRGVGGVRAGGSAVIRHDHGLSSGGATVTWTRATQPSSVNPSSTWDFNPGVGRRISSRGWAGRVSLYANALLEHSTGTPSAIAAIEGAEIELKQNLSFIVSAQQLRLGPNQRDYQWTTGLTVNLGRYRR